MHVPLPQQPRFSLSDASDHAAADSPTSAQQHLRQLCPYIIITAQSTFCFLWLSMCIPMCVFVCVSICLPVCLSVCPSISLFLSRFLSLHYFLSASAVSLQWSFLNIFVSSSPPNITAYSRTSPSPLFAVSFASVHSKCHI